MDAITATKPGPITQPAPEGSEMNSAQHSNGVLADLNGWSYSTSLDAIDETVHHYQRGAIRIDVTYYRSGRIRDAFRRHWIDGQFVFRLGAGDILTPLAAGKREAVTEWLSAERAA